MMSNTNKWEIYTNKPCCKTKYSTINISSIQTPERQIEKCSINPDKNKHCSLKGNYFHLRVVFSLFSAGLFLVYCLPHSLNKYQDVKCY